MSRHETRAARTIQFLDLLLGIGFLLLLTAHTVPFLVDAHTEARESSTLGELRRIARVWLDADPRTGTPSNLDRDEPFTPLVVVQEPNGYAFETTKAGLVATPDHLGKHFLLTPDGIIHYRFGEPATPTDPPANIED